MICSTIRYLLMLIQHLLFDANFTIETDAGPALCFIASKSLFLIKCDVLVNKTSWSPILITLRRI